MLTVGSGRPARTTSRRTLLSCGESTRCGRGCAGEPAARACRGTSRPHRQTSWATSPSSPRCPRDDQVDQLQFGGESEEGRFRRRHRHAVPPRGRRPLWWPMHAYAVNGRGLSPVEQNLDVGRIGHDRTPELGGGPAADDSVGEGDQCSPAPRQVIEFHLGPRGLPHRTCVNRPLRRSPSVRPRVIAVVRLKGRLVSSFSAGVSRQRRVRSSCPSIPKVTQATRRFPQAAGRPTNWVGKWGREAGDWGRGIRTGLGNGEEASQNGIDPHATSGATVVT